MYENDLNLYWKTVVDTIKDGVMIVDKRGVIVSINKAMERISGYTRDELLGKPCTYLNCDICEMVMQNDEDYWCALFKNGRLDMRECTFQKKNQDFVPVLKNASLLKDAEGQVIGAVETIADISELLEKENKINQLRKALSSENGFQGILGNSPPMRRVFELIANAAGSDAPVIVFGESGTGKELIAQAIHSLSRRKHKPYVKVNCAALNESLLESELFGHVKGAFTGAYQDRKGRFEAARKGTLFLDEIGDLPLSTQVKLLRVLEDNIIERVGDNRQVHIDVRILTATNRDLNRLMEQGRFREDLFYRINVIPVWTPPLRERDGDIALLADAFFQRIRLKNDKPIQGLDTAAIQALMDYSWPGNVRELKSALEYAFVTCNEALVRPEHLPPAIARSTVAGPAPQRRRHRHENSGDEARKQRLLEALRQTGGNRSKAAGILGVSRVTVWKQMKRYGIALRGDAGR